MFGNGDWQRRLDEIIDRHADRTVALRRYFHSHPEPSGEEFETTLKLYQLLGDRKLAVRVGT
jgi:metal-dependent amidase/aminoacylase/carboxypeptidase family protein